MMAVSLPTAWRGPAVRIRLLPNDETVLLGAGPPVAEVTVQPHVLRRIVQNPWQAFADAYVSGTLEVDGDLMAVLEGAHRTFSTIAPSLALRLARRLPITRSRRRSKSDVGFHYNVGNPFFERWLDPTMTYSCAYFQTESDDLELAQRQKLELVCQKGLLSPGDHVLDIGCGWGSFVAHASIHHRVRAVGITLSEEQASYGAQRLKGMPDAHVRLLDWRDVDEAFDRIISIGMFEHVGRTEHGRFFGRLDHLLKPSGIVVLHTIGRCQPAVDNKWIRQQIFPGGQLPTLADLAVGATRAGLTVIDMENLWQHYILTIRCWTSRLEDHRAWIEEHYGSHFYRGWVLYLKASEAAFEWGDLQLFQLVLAKTKPSRWPLRRQTITGTVGGRAPT